MRELKKNRILKHKKNRVYLKLFSDGFKHYVVDVNEATRFDSIKARAIQKKFKHPENWEIKIEPISEEKKEKRYRCIRKGTKVREK